MRSLWTKKDLIAATNATDPSFNFLNKLNDISGISIDDRTIKKGELFIAIIGDKFDGHDFTKSAIKKGAGGIIVSDLELAKKYNGLLVNDTNKALINIAKFGRNRFKGTTVALTGSSGKTSTKHLLSSALKTYGKTHSTQGNNNNMIGLSLTLSRLDPDNKFCVLELGINNIGEMEELTKLALPNIALITNVSNSHIENFKNEKEIAVAKSKIFLGLEKNGVVIVNSDNVWSDLLIKEAKIINANIHLYGHSKKSDTIIIKILQEKEGATICFDDNKNLHLNYLNTTQALNAIATIAVIKELRLDLEKTLETISNIKPLPGRGEKITINFKDNKKTFIIDDSYNANPDSMNAALHNFNNMNQKLKNYESILIIGDMLELGESSNKLHLKLIPIIKKINPNILITLGIYTANISKELCSSINCYSYNSVEKLLKDIKKYLKPTQVILIKGSNGTGLWKLVPALRRNIQEEYNAA
ncbi:UDP-N-acetylmuramoyl-tripeptide--D-alanyl-D-alanine ligase [Alphaproteobacteria bacterium]|nr:UDP-N-acetylmuramoyl-tripeptide--D-alanyl-D-alanine ligase [Alphaproteobacteria bacterium]